MALQSTLGRRSYLAAVTSQGEQDAIVTLLQSLVTPAEFRIGLSDELTEGTYLWDSGEPFVYSNWIFGEPNDNPVLGGEDSVVLHNAFSYQWNDIAGSIPRTALIEVAEVIPEPRSIVLLALGIVGALNSNRAFLRRK